MTDQDRIDELLSDQHIKTILEKAGTARSQGMTVLFKWTCGFCGERVTSEQENDLYASYLHEDCGRETRTIEGELGFAVMFTINPAAAQEAADAKLDAERDR